MFRLRCTLYLMIFFVYIVVPKCEGDQVRGYDPSPICELDDCPIYNVIYSEKEFEIRNYSKALWTSYPTTVEYSIMGGIGRGQSKLLPYYFGKNDQGVHIVRTTPILMMDVLPNSSYTVHFYVPAKYQNGGIPKPVLPEITQEKLPNLNYAAVRRSIGELTDLETEIYSLKKYLQGTVYQRASLRDQFSLVLYGAATFNEGYELIIWFD